MDSRIIQIIWYRYTWYMLTISILQRTYNIKVFYYQLKHKRIVFKRIIKIYIKITIAATCFGVITIIRERTVSLLKLQFEGCLTVHLPHERKWNVNLTQQCNFIDVFLMGKPEGRRPLGRPRCRCVDNIRMDLQEVGCGYMDWIGLA